MSIATEIDELRVHLRNLADSAVQNARSTPGRAFLQRYLDALPVAALVADNHGRFVAVNEHAARLTGYTVDELRRLSVWQITPGVNEHEAESLWRAFINSGEQHGRYRVLGRGGRIVHAAYAALTDVVPGFHVSLLQRVADD